MSGATAHQPVIWDECLLRGWRAGDQDLLPALRTLYAYTDRDPDRATGLVFRYTAPALSTNGVTGSPSLATTGLGERLVDLAVAAIVDKVKRGRLEEPPLGRATTPRLSEGANAWTP